MLFKPIGTKMAVPLPPVKNGYSFQKNQKLIQLWLKQQMLQKN